jgi:hypothetical protein
LPQTEASACPAQSRPTLYERFEIDGLVFVTALQRGRGKASGVPIQSEVTLVFTVRQGVIHRRQMFRSDPEALDAVTSGK